MNNEEKFIEFNNNLKKLEQECIIKYDCMLYNAIEGKFITKDRKMYFYKYFYETSKLLDESTQRYIKFIKDLYDTDYDLILDYFYNELSECCYNDGNYYYSIEVNIEDKTKYVKGKLSDKLSVKTESLFKAIEETNYNIYYIDNKKIIDESNNINLYVDENLKNIKESLNYDGYYVTTNINGIDVTFSKEKTEDITYSMIQFAYDIIESYKKNPELYDNEAWGIVLDCLEWNNEEGIDKGHILKQLENIYINIIDENNASLVYYNIEEIGEHILEVCVDRNLNINDVILNG